MTSRPVSGQRLRGLARLRRVRDCAFRDPTGNLVRINEPGNEPR